MAAPRFDPELIAALPDALAALPPASQLVLRMHYLEGLTHLEVAEVDVTGLITAIRGNVQIAIRQLNRPDATSILEEVCVDENPQCSTSRARNRIVRELGGSAPSVYRRDLSGFTVSKSHDPRAGRRRRTTNR
jgi:hypothetical protein